VLDCPPGWAGFRNRFSCRRSAGGAAPAPLALRTLDQVREHLEAGRGKKAPLVLPVLSMVDRRKALHREVVAAHPDWPAIPMASMVEQMGTGRPRWPNSPRSAPGGGQCAGAGGTGAGGRQMAAGHPDGWVKGEAMIPKQIFQTFSCEAELPDWYAANRDRIIALNPGWDYKIYFDAECEDFIAAHYGADVLDAYRRIDPRYGAARADFFRYLLMYQRGGVYLDLKSSLTRPLDEVLAPADEFIVSRWDEAHFSTAGARIPRFPALSPWRNLPVVHHQPGGAPVSQKRDRPVPAEYPRLSL
jgi:hypothetical protein